MKKGISTQGKTQIRCSRHSPLHGTHHPGKLAERLAALGVRRDREPLPLEQLPHLSAADRRTRLIVDTFIHSSLQSGLLREKAIAATTAYYINAYRAKRSYDITTKSVTISTIHSVKGFDYACVFLLGLDWLAPGARWSEEQIRKLVYVAATRARERLFIPYCDAKEVIKMVLR